MTPEQLFSILNLVTIAAWLPLVFLPRVRWTATLVPMAVPLLLASVYVVLVAATLGRSQGGFSSLAGVRALFENPWMLLAGWAHYLAFDLFIGGWAVRNARRRGIPHLLIVPGLILTFLLGPAGLLSYLALRWWMQPRRTVEPARTGTHRGVDASKGGVCHYEFFRHISGRHCSLRRLQARDAAPDTSGRYRP